MRDLIAALESAMKRTGGQNSQGVTENLISRKRP